MLFKERPVALLRRSWPAILFGGLAGALLATLLSFTQPLEYASTVRLLITQPGATNIDPYTVLKSNERIAQNLSQLLYSSSFFENILTQAQGVDRDHFPVNEYDRRRAWARSIGTSVEPGSGLMLVTIYHPSRLQARILVQAATEELTKQAPNFFGFSVRVQVIDAPLDSRWIARPNFLNNALAGLLFGALLGLIWMMFNRERY